MQTVNLRTNKVNGNHVHCSLFMNGALLGQLVFDIGEYQIFGAALSLGATQTQGRLADNSDDKIFKQWTRRNTEVI